MNRHGRSKARDTLTRTPARRSRAVSIPATTSPALSSTADATWSGPHTMFTQACPCIVYTYSRPAGPNITALRAVGPRQACEAGSSAPS